MMKTTQAKAASIAQIGEEIGIELGTQMITEYQVANPNDTHFYVVGRNILDQILAQPNCFGIKFFSAYNELGEKTMVYVGLDKEGKAILKYTLVNPLGELTFKEGIVADRIGRGGGGGALDNDSWNWEID